ncbi:hypothetical protein [Paenibacillus sp. USHLN196]|uniref:hypothetical protein n=1 Tax=Paenibacillus sp. USHLN196 TaxID=3081291 RepID=UPI00301AB8A3
MRYSERTYEAVKEILGLSEVEIDNLSEDEVFELAVKWEFGTSSSTRVIKKIVKDVYKINLEEVR